MKFVKDVSDIEIAGKLRKAPHGRKPCPFMCRVLEQMKTTDRLRIDCDDEDEATYTYRVVYEHNGFTGNRYRVAKSGKSIYVISKEAL